MQKLSFVFSKKSHMRYISHLDLMRLFMRALRRAEIPIKMTEGFNPHPKLSIRRAMKLGLESESEEAAVVLREFMDPEDFKGKFNKALPEGIMIKDVIQLPVNA